MVVLVQKKADAAIWRLLYALGKRGDYSSSAMLTAMYTFLPTS